MQKPRQGFLFWTSGFVDDGGINGSFFHVDKMASLEHVSASIYYLHLANPDIMQPATVPYP